MRVALPFAFLLVSLVGEAKAETHFPAAGSHAAVCYTVGGSERTEAIAQKMGEAIARNREWMDAYLKKLNLKPGELLPYHENLGISREDYEFFLSDFKKLHLIKFADVTVVIQPADKETKLFIQGINLPVAEYSFSTEDSRLSCGYGTTSETTDFDQTNPESPLGKWRGREWRIKEGEADLATLADYLMFQFSMGQDETGRNIIYIKSSGLKDNQAINWGCIIRW